MRFSFKRFAKAAVGAAVFPVAAPLFAGAYVVGSKKSGSSSSSSYVPSAVLPSGPNLPPSMWNKFLVSTSNRIATGSSLSNWTTPPTAAVSPQTLSAAAAAVGGPPLLPSVGGSGGVGPFDSAGMAEPLPAPVGLLAKFNAMSPVGKAMVVGGIGVAVYLGFRLVNKGGAAGGAPKSAAP